MYFLYVDSSGQTAIKRTRQNNGFYILSGVIVHEKNWRKVEESITAIKQEMFPELDPTQWELHAHDIWNDHDLFRDEKMQLNFIKKQEIFSKVLELIRDSDITLLNVVIFKDLMQDLPDTPKTMESSWTLITERFEHFLKRQLPETNNGLFFVDSSQKTPESEIKNVIWNLVRNGSPRQRIKHVLEDPIFTRSHLRNLIQLADMIAYVVHKNYRGDSKFKEWFEKLKPKMYQPSGALFGFGIKEFPDN